MFELHWLKLTCWVLRLKKLKTILHRLGEILKDIKRAGLEGVKDLVQEELEAKKEAAAWSAASRRSRK